MSAFPRLSGHTASLRGRSPRSASTLLRLVVASAFVVLLVRGLGHLEWDRAAAALAQAQMGLVVLAALLNLTFNSAARVARRAALLRPLPHDGSGVAFGELTGLLYTNLAANSLLPARAGDALFVAQLHRRHGYPLGSLVGVQLAEKVVETTSLWILAWPVAGLLALPLSLALPLHTFLGIGTVGLLLLAFAPNFRGAAVEALLPSPEGDRVGPPGLRARLERQLHRLREALRLLRAPRVWSRAVLWSCASDGLDTLMVGLCLTAVGARTTPAVWVVVLLAVNFSILVPITPGQIGALEVAAVVALRLMDVGAGEALVFALLYHAAHVVPVALAGALAFAASRGTAVERPA